MQVLIVVAMCGLAGSLKNARQRKENFFLPTMLERSNAACKFEDVCVWARNWAAFLNTTL